MAKAKTRNVTTKNGATMGTVTAPATSTKPKQHAWAGWKAKTSRCVRKGCSALRQGVTGNYWYKKSGKAGEEWARGPAPSCTGGPTTNR